MSRTNCIYPFSAVFIDSRQDVKFCCAGSFALGNLNTSPLGDILTGPVASSVRAGQFTDEGHDYCKQCSDLMAKGVSSQRLEIKPEEVEGKTPDYYSLARIDIRWSNICNLACVYCLPYFSSKLAKINNVIDIYPISNKNETSVFDFIELHRDSVTDIMMLGGEPFLHKQNERLIDMLPNANMCIITNMTLPIETNKIAQRLLKDEYKYMTWGVSFEAIGEKYEYVRHGGQWKDVSDNLQVMRNHARSIHLFPLYCLYSAFNLVELYDVIQESGCVKHVTWQLLTNPAEDVFALSSELRQQAVEEIDRVVLKYPDAPGVDSLKSMQVSLLEVSPEVNGNHETVVWLEKMETKMKKTKKFSEVWPEIFTTLNR